MTSQTDLPLIPAGIIWDGVTQYQDNTPRLSLPLCIWQCVVTSDGWRWHP